MQTDREREPSNRSPSKHAEPFPIPGRLPVFPLPNVVFFPRTYLPLHIFESRYRRMVADVTMGDQCIAMALLKEGWEPDYYGNPAIYSALCIGRIVSVQPLSDGRSNILLQGLERCEISEEHFDKPYREATIRVMPMRSDEGLTKDVRRALIDVLGRYLQAREDSAAWQGFFREEVSDEVLVNTLSTYLRLYALGKTILAGSERTPPASSSIERSGSIHAARTSRHEGLGVEGMDRTIAINVSRLCKTYDSHKAVDDLSFQVYAGEIFGLLGPNGAGKSTTLRTLITLLHPTSGTATVMGYDTVRDADQVRTVIGYVPQERAIDRFLTGREHLQLLGALYHLTKEEAAKRIGELLKLVDLEAHADRPAKTYSGGMKRKLDIACGLLPDPKILFLDEPTLGLDVQSRLRIWEYVRMLKARGMTVVMTTNYLDEADQLCDRLAIIDGGTIKTLGSPAELKIALGGDIVSLTLKETSRIQSLESDLTGRPAIKTVRATTKGLDIRVETPEKALPTILESANRLGCEVEFIQYNRPRLDDVFIAHTGRAITESPPEVEST